MAGKIIKNRRIKNDLRQEKELTPSNLENSAFAQPVFSFKEVHMLFQDLYNTRDNVTTPVSRISKSTNDLNCSSDTLVNIFLPI